MPNTTRRTILLWATSCLLLPHLTSSQSTQLATKQSELGRAFAEALAKNVTSFSDMTLKLQALSTQRPEGSDLTTTVGQQLPLAARNSGYDVVCLKSAGNLTGCLQDEVKCIPLTDIGHAYGLTPSTTTTTSTTSVQQLSTDDVSNVAPALIYSLLTCNGGVDGDSGDASTSSSGGQGEKAVLSGRDLPPSTEATWGYSLLFVTLINLCALTGAFVLPCMRLHSYKMVLNFMVAIAVGTLAGSGLLFLIPEAFALVHDDDLGYVWKASTIMGGVYLFYLTERIMRMINDRRENTQAKKKQDELATEGTITTSFRRLPLDNAIPEKDPSHIPSHLIGASGLCGAGQLASQPSNSSSCVEFATLEGSEGNGGAVSPTDVEMAGFGGNAAHVQLLPTSQERKIALPAGQTNGHHHSHSHSGPPNGGGEVAPVAYMIIFGDALHNFIDGLSIGSAFTQSIMTGVSVSVAVICEELPHELGDLAILLNSGMPFRRALMYNFLSALTCYAGTIIGILLGENTHSHEWIFAVAGGMFLYISLVDMMPEMNSAAESPEGKQFGVWKMFLLQNIGLICGYLIMLVMAVYGGNIDFS